MSEKNIIYHDDHRNIMQNYDVNKNILNPMITKYEKANIIGTRTTELANGAPPMIIPDETDSIKDIVIKEYNEGLIPYIIKRYISDTYFEYWKFRDLVRN